MKKTLLLSVVCFLFALQGAMAYTTTTKLQLRAYDNSPIMLNVDGQNYGAYTNSQTIENLAPGFHQMQVFALVANPYSGTNTRQLLYSGGITLAEYRILDAVVNPNNNLQIVSDVAMYPTRIPVAAAPYKEPVRNYPQYDPTPSCEPVAMCQSEFDEFMCSLKKQWFDNAKVDVAKQMLSHNYVTASQVKQLLSVFSFDSYKVDIAKFAYSHTVDQERYYVVNDAFTFSSSISELTCYLNTQHHDNYSHNSGNNYGRNHHDGYANR